jgi:vancomycin resistance protein VanJ
VLAASAGVAGVLLAVITWLWRPDSGPAALIVILLPHAMLALIVVGVLGLALDRRRRSSLFVAAIVVVAVVRFGPEWLSLPARDPGGTTVNVLSWNLESGRRQHDGLVEALLAHDADVVALQELTRASAAALDTDERIALRYPFRQLVPNDGAVGLGILSSFEVVASVASQSPPIQLVTLDGETLTDRPLHVVNAHPLPGAIRTMTSLRIPIAFDGRTRNESLRVIRTAIDERLALGQPVIVAGDFNVAPTEPAYDDLAAGLVDSHVEAGLGPGWTWRPSRLEGLPLALLRIDYIFSSPAVTPTRTHVDCSRTGDHCSVLATLALPP